MSKLHPMFCFEIAFSLLFLIAGLATAINREWIETLFGVDPDAGNGMTEWAFVVALALSAVFAALARREYRRAQPLT